MKQILLTVGTTNFDILITALDNEEFYTLLDKNGFTKLILQIGNTGNYTPSAFKNLNLKSLNVEVVKLVPKFEESYRLLFGENLEERQNNSSIESVFKTYADLLFFGLYSFKSGLTYDLLALTFGLSSSNAYQNQSLVIRVLEVTLNKSGYLPKRSFRNEDELKEFLKMNEIDSGGFHENQIKGTRSIPDA